jgi:hypothetical protein
MHAKSQAAPKRPLSIVDSHFGEPHSPVLDSQELIEYFTSTRGNFSRIERKRVEAF